MSGATLMRLYCLASCATTGIAATVPAYARLITRTTPAAASISTRSPSLIAASRPGAPTTAGIAELAGEKRGVAEEAALLGGDAGEHREDRVEVAGRGDGDQHIAGLDPSDRAVVAVRQESGRPAHDTIADAQSLQRARRLVARRREVRLTDRGQLRHVRRQWPFLGVRHVAELHRRIEVSCADSERVPRGQLIRTRTLTVKQRADLVGRRVEQVVHLAQRVAAHEPPSRFEHATTDEPERPDEAEAVVVVTKAVQPARIRKQLVERRERFGGHPSAD